MKGGMGKKQRDALASQIKAVPEDQHVDHRDWALHCEGLTTQGLDTLFPGMPISGEALYSQ